MIRDTSEERNSVGCDLGVLEKLSPATELVADMVMWSINGISGVVNWEMYFLGS